MKLIKYDAKPHNWDELINKFDSKTLFHKSSWHNHISSIFRNSSMEYYYIEDDGKLVGYFCGLLVKRYSLKIMGSPLKGTGTNYMGPVVNEGINLRELIDAILKMCKDEKIIHIELCNDIFKHEVMEEFGFQFNKSVTHKIPIEKTEDEMIMSMKGTGRNRLRKAIKNGLTVEELDDETIIPLYAKQLQHVYKRQKMDVPFGEERIQSLCENLNGGDEILKLGVKYNQEIIATGLFPYDEKAIYFWGAASWDKTNELNPNEILHWEVLKTAVQKGIKIYNMCGGRSQFKNKFGGEDVDHKTYTKSFLPFVHFIRNSYKKLHWIKLKAKNLLRIPSN